MYRLFNFYSLFNDYYNYHSCVSKTESTSMFKKMSMLAVATVEVKVTKINVLLLSAYWAFFILKSLFFFFLSWSLLGNFNCNNFKKVVVCELTIILLIQTKHICMCVTYRLHFWIAFINLRVIAQPQEEEQELCSVRDPKGVFFHFQHCLRYQKS